MLGVPPTLQDGDTVVAAGGRLQTTSERGAGLRVLVPSILTIAGNITAPRTLTLPDAAVTIPTGTILTGTLANANRLDSTSSAGVIKESLIADGISTSVLTLAGTLTAPRTATFPDAAVQVTGSATALTSGRLPKGTATAGVAADSQIADGVTGNVLTIAATLTAPRTLSLPDAAVTIPSGNIITGNIANANRVLVTSSTGIIVESLIASTVTTNVVTFTGSMPTPRTKTLQNSTATLAELETSPQIFTGAQTFQSAAPITARQGATTDAIVIAPANIGSSSNTITDTTPATALGANFVQTRQAATGTVALVEVQPCASFQNKLINPRFDIWQRGTSFAAIANNFYSADRWNNLFDGTGVCTISQQAHTLGSIPTEPEYFMRYQVTSAGAGSTFRILYQPIEGVRTLAGRRVQISFWLKADAARNVLPGLSQVFGSGGSPSASVVTNGVVCSLTTAWQQFTQTVTLPSISGKTVGTNRDSVLSFALNMPLNTICTIDISEIEVKEVASSAQVNTPMEIRPLGVELGLCKRYFRRFIAENTNSPFAYGFSISTTLANAPIFLEPEMRVTPSLSVSSATHFQISDGLTASVCTSVVLMSFNGRQGVTLGPVVASGLTASRAVRLEANTTSATLDLSSEL